jgi:hypothetical protein
LVGGWGLGRDGKGGSGKREKAEKLHGVRKAVF